MPKRPVSLPRCFLAPDQKRLSLIGYLFLTLLCIASFTPGLMSLPPTDRDESSFAQASKQMIETGNYADIRIRDKPRYKKPIGIYWLQVASVQLLNPDHLNEIWAYRIPSLLGAIIAVLATAALGSLLFGAEAGFLAALMMAGCLILNVEARMAKTDAALLASVLIAQFALAKAYIEKSRSFRNAFTFWTALGAGILIKGPIILLTTISTLGWLWARDKNLKWFNHLRPAIGLPYTLLLVLPWFLLMIIGSHGSFVAQSAGHDLLGKIWQGEFRGIIPPGAHLLAFPVAFFPFALFVFLAIPDIWKNRNDPRVSFCLGWIIPVWILFELSLTKLPHYVLPVYPALAILAAKALVDGLPVLAARPRRWYLALVIGLWMTINTGFLLAFIYLPYITGQEWSLLQIAVSLAFISLQGFSLFLLLFRRRADSVLFLSIGTMLLMTVTLGVTLPRLKHVWLSQEIAQIAEANKPCEDSRILSSTYDEPSLIFLAGTRTQFVASGSLVALRMWFNPCNIGLIDKEHQKSFLDVFAKTPDKLVTLGTVEGYNAGRGNMTSLTLYRLQNKATPP